MVPSILCEHIVRFVEYHTTGFFCRCKFLVFDSRTIKVQLLFAFSELITYFSAIRIFAFWKYCLIYQKIVQCRETKFKIWFKSTDLLCSFRLWCFFYSINYNDALLSFALNFTNGGCKLIYDVSHILHFCLLLGLFLLFSLHHIWGKLQFLCKPLQNLVWTFKCKVKDSNRSA